MAMRPRDGATCTSAANAASYRDSRMPRPRNAHTARYAASLRTWARAYRPAEMSTVPSVITARPPAVPNDPAPSCARYDAHREQGDGEAQEDEAPAPAGVLADRPREDAEAVVAGPPGGDLGDAERKDRSPHRIGKPSRPSPTRLHRGGSVSRARGRNPNGRSSGARCASRRGRSSKRIVVREPCLLLWRVESKNCGWSARSWILRLPRGGMPLALRILAICPAWSFQW